MATKDYKESLEERLSDIEYAAGYLDACLKEGDEAAMLIALQDVARVHGGINELAENTELNRTTLYKMLSEQGNPTLLSLNAVLRVFGLRLAIAKNSIDDSSSDDAA